MYLRRLDMQGFKSFVEKISLEFSQGITAVVGPNGSGKSNIADAIRWVLGEQSIKMLRGNKMEDVIFSGTEHRKPVGFAEVSITIDNADMTLPIEYSEVTITRRVYRSGESEYLINKTPCRLKDITELLLDTGIGKEGYSVIGQGRVDEILSNRSEERRHIFEEASGIMKYKVRKQEAEKKLELTRQNLERINDIIVELEAQLGPLKEQSETARRYLALRENLKELDINIFLDSIEKFRNKLDNLDEQYKTLKNHIESEEKKLDEITLSNKEKTAYLKTIDERMETARRRFYELESGLEQCFSEIKLNNEKIANNQQNIQRLDAEIAELREKLAGLELTGAGKQEKLKYLETQLAEYGSKLSEYEKQMEELLKTLDESEKHIEELKSGIIAKMDIQSDKKIQIGNIRTHIENIRKRQKSIDNEVYGLILEKDREKIKKEDLEESIDRASKEIDKRKEMIRNLSGKREKCDIALKDLKEKQVKLKTDIQFKTSRLKALSEMEKNLEGYNRSVREVLKACRESRELGEGIHGALAQLIKPERKYETAIEISLGSALQNIVTSTEKDAQKAIEYLKEKKLGRATFLPVSSVHGKSLDSSTLERVKKHKGFLGIASGFVSFDSQYKGIIDSLLGRVAVVDNLDNAIGMARSFGYSFRIVTLDGDLLNTGGSISGGSIENKGTGILSRSREIEELEKELRELKISEKTIDGEIESLVGEVAGIDSEIESIEKDMKNYELEKIRDESHLAQVDENTRKISARIDMLRNENEQLERQAAENNREMEKYINELEVIEKEMDEARELVEKHRDKHKADQSARDELHSLITDYKISVNSITESMESIKENFEKLSSEKEGINKNIEKKEKEKIKCQDEIRKLGELNEGLNQQIKKYDEERSGKTFELDKLSEERKTLEEELYDTVNKINDINKNIHLLQEEHARVEVKKTKLETEMNSLQDRIWNEYELTYASALMLKKNIGSIAQANKRITELRNEIKELGPVNVVSIDEYVKTKERYDFMIKQRNDMEQAREKLLRVIQEMTSVMKKQFMNQFKLINDNFNEVFRELFSGGKAELALEDEENVLESGIEIHAQPPGKKLQHMTLLSGGERALTAIALLFAILKLKPTPFCILDEIEATLDEANVYRFIEYLKRYSGKTQFIVVTHRRGTMEGADTLYGVTMQEHGISKIISMKMGEKVG
ncbi:MAG: chromosome segregation protein SMC [Bacillota bacterium]